MRLKALEISGFKSFADKTKIEFMPGMTGIVGPNGSGKSNISEAIRWVMGEQSAKSLRGSRMPDVIFGGSEDRAPLNRAQVNIIFDNSDHYLKTDFSELTITRKLFRSGESHYEINGSDCRLKDIIELFLDTGLGQESFSIISQGRVEAIFNSKPEDRRAIIEEVAGVFKYKKDKEKAEKELADTTDYLDRVNDILSELDSQIAPLEQQSTLARDYLDQKARFDLLDRTQIVRNLDTETTQKADLDKAVISGQALVTRYQNTVNQQQTALDDLKQRQASLNQQKDQLQAQLLTVTEQREALNGEQNLSTQRQTFRAQTEARLKEQLATQQTQIDDTNTELTALATKITTQKSLIKDANDLIEHLTQATSTERIDTIQHQIDQLRDAYVDQMQALTSVHNDQRYLAQTHTQEQQKNQKAIQQLAGLKQHLTETSQANETATTALQAQEHRFNDIKTAFDEAHKQHQAAQTKHEQLRRTWLDQLNQVERLKTQVTNMTSASQEHNGFYQGVRAILNHRTEFDGVYGAVSDLITVPNQYTAAIELALGSQLQQIVTASEAGAKQAISYLTKNRLGRATFLPLTTLSVRTIDDASQQTMQQTTGFEGIASQLVTTDPTLQKALDYLLGTTIVMDTLDHALALQRTLKRRYRLVTITGDIVSASGAITGGQNKHDRNGLLAQRQQLEKLSASLNEQQTALEKAEHQVKQAEDCVTRLEADGRDLVEQRSALQDSLSELRETAQLAGGEFGQAKRAYEAAKRLSDAESDAESSYTTQEKALTERATALEQSLQENQQQVAQFKQQIDDLKHDRSGKTSDLVAQRETLATQKEQLRQLVQNERDLEQTLTEIQRAANSSKQQLDELTEDADQQAHSTKSLAEQLAELTQSHQELTAQLATTQETLGGVNDQINSQSEANLRDQQLLQAAKDDAQDKVVNQARLAAVIDGQLNRLAEKYQMSLAAAKENLSDLDDAELSTQLKLLKRGLNEIGEVNLGSIEEYDRVKTRYDFLHKQHQDLVDAKAQLIETMGELDGEVVTRFKAAFDQVAEKFSATFMTMFGGGRAELILTDPDNLLTSGIDIMAQPPGKRFQNMSLLSGGERSLTAITLLFAILQVSPVPFCLLDEAEAALDPANVTRFAQYISRFQDQTQFIVITHRKETMVQANTLYGVTMQESGVSKIVSVDLDEVAS